MDLQIIFFIFKKNVHILIATIFCTTCMVEALSVDSKFVDCVPRNCGKGPNISHPFWISKLQESHCGLPGFETICKNQHPVLEFSNDDYIINDIFYGNHAISLAKAEVYDEDNKCPVPQHNFSTEGSPFGCVHSADLLFFYNCSSPLVEERYLIECASNATHHAFAVFDQELLAHKNYWPKSCQGLVKIPVVNDTTIRQSNSETSFVDILKKGFVLQWNQECSTCQKSGSGLHLGRKVAVGLGTVGFTILVMCLIFFFCHRQYKKRYATPPLISRDISTDPTADLEKAGTYFGLHIFTYSELEEATDNFDSTKELGDGAFGIVYQGELRDGRLVAVKRLYEKNCKRVEQFMNEVEILTQLRHQNLVSLFGCTSRHSRELLLVYEYISNGTIADHLHGERAKPGSLTWKNRLSIAVEIASALAYLHASDVIHRDVKTNNILLDSNFCVKVADFGLSRLFPTDVTHVSTAPQGTPGYVDPEYHQCYQLTDKSDVFSFGVVLIELISSKPAVDITRDRHEINLSNMAINKIQNHGLHELVDPSLGFDSDDNISRMITDVAALAFRCLQDGKEMRPSMVEVLQVLKGIQSEHYNIEKTQKVDIPAENGVALLKRDPLTLSPKSVTANWASKSTTPNTSG